MGLWQPGKEPRGCQACWPPAAGGERALFHPPAPCPTPSSLWRFSFPGKLPFAAAPKLSLSPIAFIFALAPLPTRLPRPPHPLSLPGHHTPLTPRFPPSRERRLSPHRGAPWRRPRPYRARISTAPSLSLPILQLCPIVLPSLAPSLCPGARVLPPLSSIPPSSFSLPLPSRSPELMSRTRWRRERSWLLRPRPCRRPPANARDGAGEPAAVPAEAQGGFRRVRRGCGRLHSGGALRRPGAAVRPRRWGEWGDPRSRPARPGPLPRPPASAQLSPAASAMRGAGHGSAWQDPARTTRPHPVTHLPSSRPGFPPSLRESPTPHLRAAQTLSPQGGSDSPPTLRGSQSPSHGGLEPPSLRATQPPSPVPAESSSKTAQFPPSLRGSRSLPPSLGAAQTPRADLAPGPLAWRDRSLSLGPSQCRECLGVAVPFGKVYLFWWQHGFSLPWLSCVLTRVPGSVGYWEQSPGLRELQSGAGRGCHQCGAGTAGLPAGRWSAAVWTVREAPAQVHPKTSRWSVGSEDPIQPFSDTA